MINPPFNPFVKVRSLARSWVKKIPIYRRHIEQVDQLKNELANERRKTNIVLEQLGNVSSDYQHLTATSRQLQAESNQLQNEKDRTESHLNLIIAQVRHTSKKQKERTQTLETQLSHAQVQLKTARRQGALEIIDKAQSIASRRVMQAYATKMLRDGNGTTTYEQDANELHSFGVSRDAARALVDSEKENRAQTERIAMLQATRLPDAAKSLSQLRGYQIPFAIYQRTNLGYIPTFESTSYEELSAKLDISVPTLLEDPKIQHRLNKNKKIGTRTDNRKHRMTFQPYQLDGTTIGVAVYMGSISTRVDKRRFRYIRKRGDQIFGALQKHLGSLTKNWETYQPSPQSI